MAVKTDELIMCAMTLARLLRHPGEIPFSVICHFAALCELNPLECRGSTRQHVY